VLVVTELATEDKTEELDSTTELDSKAEPDSATERDSGRGLQREQLNKRR
jgi:hypothetical protein